MDSVNVDLAAFIRGVYPQAAEATLALGQLDEAQLPDAGDRVAN
jgi:hypothetical protein